MYRRMASRSSSLTVRSSSFTTCRSRWAISGGREKVMVSVFLGLTGMASLSPAIIAQRLTLIISPPQPFRQGLADGDRAGGGLAGRSR